MSNTDQAQAQKRFIILNVIRIGGAVLLALGLAVLANGFAGLPKAVGVVLFVVGIVDFLVIPVALSKRWKSPTDL